MSTAAPPIPVAATPGWRARLTDSGQTYGALAALVVLVVLNVVFTPNFATPSTLWIILLQASTTVLVSLGMTVVLAAGGIDLSVGSIMAVASAVAALTIGHGGGVAVVAGLGAAVGFGLLNGLLVAGFGIQSFIVTLALLLTGRGLALVLSNQFELPPLTNAGFEVLGRGHVGPAPMPVVLAMAAAAATLFVMRATSFGRYLLAVGGNERAARLAGVPVYRTQLAAFATSGLLAGLAGLIETARLGVSDPTNIGVGMEFNAIAAAVIGGTSLGGGRATVVGTVVGALIMVVIAASFNMLGIPYAWALVIQAAIILGAVYVQRPRVV